jgi:hypothetical protein
MCNIAGNLMRTTLSILTTNHSGSDFSWAAALCMMNEKKISIQKKFAGRFLKVTDINPGEEVVFLMRNSCRFMVHSGE